MVPGQRLVETELALHFGVGRNAVREAMQRLAVRGVVDLRPNQSASIRELDINETIEILEVAAEMTSISESISARNYDTALHGAAFKFMKWKFTDSEAGRRHKKWKSTGTGKTGTVDI